MKSSGTRSAGAVEGPAFVINAKNILHVGGPNLPSFGNCGGFAKSSNHHSVGGPYLPSVGKCGALAKSSNHESALVTLIRDLRPIAAYRSVVHFLPRDEGELSLTPGSRTIPASSMTL